MKTKLFIIPGLLLILLSFGNNALASNKEERKVNNFTGVSLQIAATLYLEQGNVHKVVIDAESDLLENIETEVVNGILKIKLKKWYKQQKERATVYITMPDIENLSISGSGKIIAENEIKTDELDLSISGSGDIQFNELKANKVNSAISGSGDITLAGSNVMEKHKIATSGSGSVRCEKLETKDIEISISGSGNCKVFATENLEAHVSGSADVYYYGKPRVNAAVSGSGNVKSLE